VAIATSSYGLPPSASDPSGFSRPKLTPQEIAYPIAVTDQALVQNRQLTDCQALAAFAASMATLTSSTKDFMDSFGVLVAYVPGEQALGIQWNTEPVTLGILGESGFGAQFQDGYGSTAGANGSDQAHHFAAFFQAGYFNLANATAAVYVWEAQNALTNKGDINLGLAAAALGGLVSAGVEKPSQVADDIRKLCAH
jgi:hypothetical protein